MSLPPLNEAIMRQILLEFRTGSGSARRIGKRLAIRSPFRCVFKIALGVWFLAAAVNYQAKTRGKKQRLGAQRK